uniref:Uncharacterized protein n=1 Tax=Arundo donax TaxID=35708 RepID=A0A0A9EKK1_ARUDO
MLLIQTIQVELLTRIVLVVYIDETTNYQCSVSSIKMEYNSVNSNLNITWEEIFP